MKGATFNDYPVRCYTVTAMFNETELSKIIRLQQKSFLLLQWVRGQMDAGTLNVSTVESATAFYPVAHAWITGNRASFPRQTRPDEDDVETFTHLFVAFLTTSYKIPPPKVGTPKPVPSHYARLFAPASLLQVRTPDKKATASAQQMKDLYLVGLAADLGVPLPFEERERLATDAALAQDVSFAAYGRELMRRSQFASQGEGILVLWREIAWTGGKLNKKFVLTSARIMEAEARLCAQIQPPH